MSLSRFRGVIGLSAVNGVLEPTGWMLRALVVAGIGCWIFGDSTYLFAVQFALGLGVWFSDWCYTQFVNPASKLFPDRSERIAHHLTYVTSAVVTFLAIAAVEWALISAWWGYLVAGAVLCVVMGVLESHHYSAASWAHQARTDEGFLPPSNSCPRCGCEHSRR